VSGKKNRYRSTDNVLAELDECVRVHGIRNFLFRSDLFTQDREWVIELCRKILDRGMKIEWASNSRVDSVDPEMLQWMKRAGCWIIAYGVESGNAEILEKIRKKATLEQSRKAIAITREAGIRSSIYFLMGLPWDTPETLEDNIRFANELKADFIEIFYIYPFPGTELHRFALEHGLLEPGEIPKAAYSHAAMPGFTMSREELDLWRRRTLRRIYLRPGYICRTLRNVRTPAELGQYLKLGVLTLKDILFGNRSPGSKRNDGKTALDRSIQS
jgi:radical SAM superfamily enzyme YgiQ (UPF0313 family)